MDDSAKVGDVDLLIKLEAPIENKTVLAAKYNALLKMKLGMQKFNILIIDPSMPLKEIHQKALSDGLQL